MLNLMRLKGKVSVITGAAAGIGYATALRFAEEGAKVEVLDVKRGSVDSAIGNIKAKVPSALIHGHEVDVTNREQVKQVFEKIIAEHSRVDVLVNNAGITADAQFKKMTDDQFDKVIAVNLTGVYNCSRAVVNQMIEQKSGVILNASSVVGVYGNFGQTNYAATKWGVIGFVKTWCKELAKNGIRTNAVCPGFILTDMVKAMPPEVLDKIAKSIPAGRLGEPEEIASVYAFLASDDASYINGAAIEVTGGKTL